MRPFMRAVIAYVCLALGSAFAVHASAQSPAPNTIFQTPAGLGQFPYSAADVEFMSGMIAHHAQALVMAGWAQSHGAGPSIQTLAGRIINGQQGTAARTRVLIDSTDGETSWGTVGVSDNIIEASWLALVDSFEFKLRRETRA